MLQVERLQSLPKLREINLWNNPIQQKTENDAQWRIEIIKRLDKLKVARALRTPACTEWQAGTRTAARAPRRVPRPSHPRRHTFACR